jgi:hypothetical protein
VVSQEHPPRLGWRLAKNLIRYLAFIYLKMVRAGIVQHTGEWLNGGYLEIQNPKQWYALIDRQKLAVLLRINIDL